MFPTFVRFSHFKDKSYFRRMRKIPEMLCFVTFFHSKKIQPMNNPAIRNGIYSMLIMLTAFIATQLIWGNTLPYRTAEVIGYISIFISLSFVFFGIRAYREEKNGGVISFGKAFQVGLIITLFPSIAFGLYTIGLFLFQGDEMMEYYMKNMPESDRQQFEANPELFSNPFFQGIIMFLTVFIIGLVISLISAWILKRQLATA